MSATRQVSPTTPSAAIPKTAKAIVWVVILAIAWALYPKAEKEYARMSEAQAKQKLPPPIPRVNIRCGNGTGAILAGLGKIPKAALVLYPGDCWKENWSEWIVLPTLWQLKYDSRTVGSNPQRDTDPTYAVVAWQDDRGNKFEDGPAIREHHEGPPPREIRLKNLTNEPVVVTLRFVY